MKQGTQSLCSGTTQRNRMGRKVDVGFRMGGTNAYLWPIHVDVWQKSSQYCNYSPFKIINKKYTPENFSQAIEFQLCIFFLFLQFSSVQSLSRLRLFATPWITAPQASLSITISQSSFRLTSIESVMPSSHLILCRPLLLLPPIPPSIRVFSNKSTLHMRWPKYWSFSFSIIPSKEHPGLISFRMDWLDPLAVQGTLRSLLQHHSSKASILRRSAFFTVQLSHPYMTTRKTIALSIVPLLCGLN